MYLSRWGCLRGTAGALERSGGKVCERQLVHVFEQVGMFERDSWCA